MSPRQDLIRELELTRELERRRCADSFEYFLENYCYIEDKQTNSSIPFLLWASQKRILPTFLTAMLLIILKARQLGLTWLTAAYALWSVVFKPLQLIVVISAKEEWAIEFLDRVKFMRDRLPIWMMPPTKQETGQLLSFKHPKNELSEIKSLATTVEGAQSKTPNLLILDETARNRYVKSIFASSKPGIDKAGGRIIVISNSHKDGVGWGWTRKTYQNAMAGLNTFKRIFMPWQDCPERPANFKEIQIAGGVDDDDFSQNYPETEEEAVSALLGSYFGKSLKGHKALPGITGYLQKDRHDKYEFIKQDKAILEIWRYPYYLLNDYDGLNWSNRYCIGSDVCEGLGETPSVAYVLDRKRDQVVARLSSNRIDAHAWAKELHKLSLFYDNAIICAERTGAGQTTVKHLDELRANQTIQLVPDKVGSGMTKKWGFNTTQQSKHELCGDLKAWLRHTQGGVFCGTLITECGTWIRHENGKLGPEDGAYGDHVMGAGLTIQASQFIGVKAEKAKKPVEGWRARQKGGSSAWAA